jgi:cation diffusion facilitator family transporter
MAAKENPTSHIVQSLVVNLIIAGMKAVAAVLTKSGAMLAEALHSAADCMNQVLLLIGVKQAQKAPDSAHPLGYGRNTYFWSFMVALMLFAGGGVFSIYEGIHKIHEPEAVTRVWIGVVILAGSILLEGAACFSNIKELNRRRGAVPFGKFLRDTKDADLVVVFGENSAAVMGLVLALVALLLAAVTGDGRWDGAGSLAVGVVLVGVAIFLAVEVKSLLIGEAADPAVEAAAHEAAKDSLAIGSVLHVITVQQGPGEVLVAIKVTLQDDKTTQQVCRAINVFEERLRSARPEVRWCFVEPDVHGEGPASDDAIPSQRAVTQQSID